MRYCHGYDMYAYIDYGETELFSDYKEGIYTYFTALRKSYIYDESYNIVLYFADYLSMNIFDDFIFGYIFRNNEKIHFSDKKNAIRKNNISSLNAAIQWINRNKKFYQEMEEYETF